MGNLLMFRISLSVEVHDVKLCASRLCCLDEDEASRVADRVSTALLAVSRSRVGAEVGRDVEAVRNAMAKVVGGVRALRSRVKNVRSLLEVNDVSTVVNTFVNTLNRVVEVRNLLQRMAEVSEDNGLQNVASLLRDAVVHVDALTIEISAIALHAIHGLKTLSRDDCGKLASAIGTALFAALLNADKEVVRSALARCFPLVST